MSYSKKLKKDDFLNICENCLKNHGTQIQSGIWVCKKCYRKLTKLNKKETPDDYVSTCEI